VRYFRDQQIKLIGGGEWRTASCPFHRDDKPSLRVHLISGGFRCHACGAHGGDVLEFHRLRYGLGFIEAARQLGAWEGQP
jgi:DNA primase